MDLLSSICKQLNLITSPNKKGGGRSGRSSETVAARNIVEVPEDFTLDLETDATAEGDLSQLVESAEELLFPTEVPVVGESLDSAPAPASVPSDPLDSTLATPQPETSLSLTQPEPLSLSRDPLDLDSLDLGVACQDDFPLSELQSPLDDDIDGFSLLLP